MTVWDKWLQSKGLISKRNIICIHTENCEECILFDKNDQAACTNLTKIHKLLNTEVKDD